MENSPPTLKSPFHFKLSSVFALVAYFALGFTALKLATHGWTVAVTSITALLFLAGLFRIIFGTKSARTFWSGFTICGGGYLALLLILNWCDSPPDRSRRRLVNDLATTEALDFLARKFNPEVEKHITANMPNPVFDYADQFEFSGGPAPAAYAPAYTRPTLGFSPGPSADPFGDPAFATIAEGTRKADDRADTNDKSAANAAATPFDDPSVLSDTPPVPPQSVPQTTSPYPVLANPFANPPPPPKPSNDLQALTERLRNFPRIGHCLFALAFGWIGATLAVVLTHRANSSPVST